MPKIENVQDVSQTKPAFLDICQFQMISMYEQLANEENIYDYMVALARNRGYSICFEPDNGKLRFTGCSPQYGGRCIIPTINDQFEVYVIECVKKMLTDWHNQTQYRVPPFCSLIEGREYSSISIQLTKRQRGILTKILKTENKRKELLKRCD
ncbi:MAG: hypothetical protein JWM92_245 [Candidatus Nomurabacteria bacterium]|jgi:hypothetical protein|nr:hypothetical protein [Candidatus Nomurabacteria bacterium]